MHIIKITVKEVQDYHQVIKLVYFSESIMRCVVFIMQNIKYCSLWTVNQNEMKLYSPEDLDTSIIPRPRKKYKG